MYAHVIEQDQEHAIEGKLADFGSVLFGGVTLPPKKLQSIGMASLNNSQHRHQHGPSLLCCVIK